MKMKNPNKRIIALILALAMSMSLSAPAWAAEQESDTSAAQVETLAESAAEEVLEESTQAPETAEVSAPVEESAEEPQAEEPEEEAVQEEPQAEKPEEEAAPQQDEEAEAPAPEEAQPEEAAEAEESAQEPQEPQKDADEALASQEDEDLEYKWQIYKKFLEYQKAGKAADFAYTYEINGCTIHMTPVGNGVYDAVITGKGLCTCDYPAYIDDEENMPRGYEWCFCKNNNGKTTVEGAPSSVRALLNQMKIKKASKKYTQPEIRTLTFGKDITEVGQLQGFFGDNKIRNLVVPGNIQKFGTKKSNGEMYQMFYGGNDGKRYEHFDSVTIQEGVEEIGAFAFKDATINGGKGKIVLPKSVRVIGYQALAANVSEIEAMGSLHIVGSYALDIEGKKITVHGNLTAAPGTFFALKADNLETLVVGGDLILPHKNHNDSIYDIGGTKLRTITVDGDAAFYWGNFGDTPNFESLTVKGNAYFGEATFSGYFDYKSHIATPKKIIVGGNATFEKETVANYSNHAKDCWQLQEITVKGNVTQKKNSWTGTPIAKSGAKSRGTTKIKVSSKTTKKETSKKTKTLSATKLTSVKFKKNKNPKKSTTTIKWKINKKGTGYQLQYSTNKKFKKGVKTINIKKNKVTSKVIKGMKKGKYFFRIRTVGKVNKKTVRSKWSGVKGVTVK